MPIVTIITSLLLVALGIIAFVTTGSTHHTALIPAFIGSLLFLMGILAYHPPFRKHTMHASVLVSLIGCLGAVSRFRHIPTGFMNGNIPPALLTSGLMATLCLGYIVIAVSVFIRVRKTKSAQ